MNIDLVAILDAASGDTASQSDAEDVRHEPAAAREPESNYADSAEGTPAHEFKVDDRVRALDLNNIGTVVAIAGNDVDVEFVSRAGYRKRVTFQPHGLQPLKPKARSDRERKTKLAVVNGGDGVDSAPEECVAGGIKIRVEDHTMTGAGIVSLPLLVLEAADERLEIVVPNEVEPDPVSWLPIGALTDVSPASMVAAPSILAIQKKLAEIFSRHPLQSAGLNNHLWAVIRARKLRPFIEGADARDAVQRTGLCMVERDGDRTFRLDVEAGASSGCIGIVTEIEGRIGVRRLKTRAELRSHLLDVVRFDTPGAAARDVILDALMTMPTTNLRTLRGLVRTPVLRADGSVAAGRGYDQSSALWIEPAFVIEDVPDSPTEDDVIKATRLLADEWLGDFAFASPGAKHAALAAAMTMVIMPMIEGAPRPIVVIEATEQDTGKSLLAKCLGALVLGREPPNTTLAKSDDENRKKIFAQLKGGAEVLYYDNVTRMISGDALAAVATSCSYEDRVLGASEIAKVANRALILITANGAKTDTDLARRILLVQLDRRGQNNELRKFRHPDILRWTIENRGELFRALMILVRRWLALGRPASKLRWGSFEQWANVIGGTFEACGMEGLDECRRDAFVRDEEREIREEFIQLWAAKHGLDEIGTTELVALADEAGLIEQPCSKRSGYVARSILRPFRKRKIAGYLIDCSRDNTGARYKLQSVDSLPVKTRSETIVDVSELATFEDTGSSSDGSGED